MTDTQQKQWLAGKEGTAPLKCENTLPLQAGSLEKFKCAGARPRMTSQKEGPAVAKGCKIHHEKQRVEGFEGRNTGKVNWVVQEKVKMVFNEDSPKSLRTREGHPGIILTLDLKLGLCPKFSFLKQQRGLKNGKQTGQGRDSQSTNIR